MARPSSQTAVQSRRRGAAPALVQIAIAVPDLETAARIATALLERRLGACVQTVGPVTSRYRWQGNLEIASEYLLLVKTQRTCYPAVEAVVLALHPYDVPEILATAVQAAWAPYAEWVAASTAPPTRAPRRPRTSRTPRTPATPAPARRVRAPRAARSRRPG